jgi:hypothetical protein
MKQTRLGHSMNLETSVPMIHSRAEQLGFSTRGYRDAVAEREQAFEKEIKRQEN